MLKLVSLLLTDIYPRNLGYYRILLTGLEVVPGRLGKTVGVSQLKWVLGSHKSKSIHNSLHLSGKFAS
jgi:hypothetical protein